MKLFFYTFACTCVAVLAFRVVLADESDRCLSNTTIALSGVENGEGCLELVPPQTDEMLDISLVEKGRSPSPNSPTSPRDHEKNLESVVSIVERITGDGALSGEQEYELLQALLEAGANPNQKNQKGEAALHIATRTDNRELVQLLVNGGADIDLRENYRGDTPLLYAIRIGKSAIAELLLSLGASITEKDGNGLSSINLAAQVGEMRVLRKILEQMEETLDPLHLSDPLLVAVRANKASVVALLLSSGADPQSRKQSRSEGLLGDLALTTAAAEGHRETVSTLIAGNAQITADSGAALYAAAQHGHLEIVKLLLKKGADPNLARLSWDGRTPLMAAAEKGDASIVKLLLEKGANRNYANKEGETALSLAERQDSNEEVLALLR